MTDKEPTKTGLLSCGNVAGTLQQNLWFRAWQRLIAPCIGCCAGVAEYHYWTRQGFHPQGSPLIEKAKRLADRQAETQAKESQKCEA